MRTIWRPAGCAPRFRGFGRARCDAPHRTTISHRSTPIRWPRGGGSGLSWDRCARGVRPGRGLVYGVILLRSPCARGAPLTRRDFQCVRHLPGVAWSPW